LRAATRFRAPEKFASNLLQTWHYFYNSCGWDDYPPQVHFHEQKVEASVTPVATTAHVIRVARILRLAALELGKSGDAATYAADIERFGAALAPAWDDEAGYFSYIGHDENGQIEEILRHESGANFNMGMDGTSPLIAGVCSEE